MKKQLVVLVAAIALVSLALVPALAGESGPAGNSNVGHVYLYQKSSTYPWDFDMDGAWGRVTYNLSGPEFAFLFNGHGLEPGTDHTLIYYPSKWWAEDLICLGDGMANSEGDIHIRRAKDTGDLSGEIRLVWSEDVDCDSAWMYPRFKHLFSDGVITYENTGA